MMTRACAVAMAAQPAIIAKMGIVLWYSTTQISPSTTV